MHSVPYLLFLFALVSLNISCSQYQRDEQYNPETQQLEDITYSDYYQLKTLLHAQQLELTMVTNLNKEVLPITYQIKKSTRRLLPNDYMIPSDVNLYLKNLGDQDLNIELLAVSVENRHLPLSQRTVKIPAKESLSFHLGRIPIDLRQNSLYTTIEYIADEHAEKAFDMKRIIHFEKEKSIKKQ